MNSSGENSAPSDGSTPAIAVAHEQILGVCFSNGSALDAVEHLKRTGGFMVVPASPALLKLSYDEEYRRALQRADLAIADSGLLVILWKIATRRRLTKISGIAYLKCLLEHEIQDKGSTFWVVSSDSAKEKAIQWLRENDFRVDQDDFYVAPRREVKGEDYAVLLEIEKRRPLHVVIAISGGTQEKLGLYLRDYLRCRPKPNIHCVGAALGFLTGEEPPISERAERYYLGWLLRLLSQPHMILPRLGIACALAGMIFKYRSNLPPLRDRWTDR